MCERYELLGNNVSNQSPGYYGHQCYNYTHRFTWVLLKVPIICIIPGSFKVQIVPLMSILYVNSHHHHTSSHVEEFLSSKHVYWK